MFHVICKWTESLHLLCLELPAMKWLVTRLRLSATLKRLASDTAASAASVSSVHSVHPTSPPSTNDQMDHQSFGSTHLLFLNSPLNLPPLRSSSSFPCGASLSCCAPNNWRPVGWGGRAHYFYGCASSYISRRLNLLNLRKRATIVLGNLHILLQSVWHLTKEVSLQNLQKRKKVCGVLGQPSYMRNGTKLQGE